MGGTMANHLFGQIRARMPAAAAAFCELPGGEVVSYAGLEAGAARYARALVALGVQPGDRVAVQVEKSFAAVLLYLGTLRAGGVFLPLNSAYTIAELDYFIGDSEPALIVCDPARRAGIAGIARQAGVETLDSTGAGTLAERAAAAAADFADIARAPEDLAAILYTSGTTGRSKGAMLTHENLASNARVLVDYWRFTREDILIHALPIFHSHGLFVATNTVLFSGAAMILRAKFDADDVLALMARSAGRAPTVLMGVPTFYFRLAAHPGLTREATARMRLFISGSAPLLAETHRLFAAKCGHAILERYGMTEINMQTSNPYDGARVPGTVGLPLPGSRLRIAEPDSGAPLPCGSIGMIEVAGPNVFKGYWRQPEKTRAEFRADGFFITGDLGKIDEKGYVHILGRGKDLIITGGFNVYPKEIEGEIDALPGVVESAVIGLPHKDFGEGVTAVVVPEKGASLSEAGILQALEERLARFKQPKRVILVAELPRNTMAKVQKNVLRETYKDLYR